MKQFIRTIVTVLVCTFVFGIAQAQDPSDPSIVGVWAFNYPSLLSGVAADARAQLDNVPGFRAQVEAAFKTTVSYGYPHDVDDIAFSGDMRNEVDVLITANRINIPITTKAFEDGQPTATSLRTFETPAAFTRPLLKKIFDAKGTEIIDSLERRLTIQEYDTNGNAVSLLREDGIPVTYLWGYNSEYPVVKVENATYSQVIATGVILGDLNNPTDDSALRAELDKIRDGLPQAMVTSYTYLPQVGITSVTDPRGYTTTYHYDAFNRLITVKDHQGHILTEHEYHYTTQQ